jgi:protein SCO1/2
MTTTISNKLNRNYWPGLIALAMTITGFALAAGSLVLWPEGDSSSSAAVATDEEQAPKALRGIHYAPPRTAPALIGLDHNAKTYSLERQPHPLAMVFFGYVSCTDVCPTNLKKFEKIQAALGDRADQVQFVFVSVDPKNERPETMKKYLKNYEGEIIGITGKYDDSLDEAYDQWGIVRKRVELDEPIAGKDYKFDHSGQIYLVQQGEKIPVSYPYGMSVDTMIEDVEALLDDPSLGERLPEVGEVKEVAIKAGTFTRAAQDKPTLPAYLRVNVGDAIRWKNNDYMYHFIGDISLAPGGEAMQKFEEPGEFYFGCTAVPSEVIRIKVMENPQSESTDQANPRSDM